MESALSFVLEEAGYRRIETGAIGVFGNISKWLDDYFSVKENLQNFVRRNGEDGLEVMMADRSRGYVFVGSLQIDQDYEKRMTDVRKRFESQGRRAIRYFVDKEEELAGFSWVFD